MTPPYVRTPPRSIVSIGCSATSDGANVDAVREFPRVAVARHTVFESPSIANDGFEPATVYAPTMFAIRPLVRLQAAA